ncbi:MAG: hypothetical protein IPG23_19245 [Burkholderiales bacterium]|nr:hypothetical protein [Burkholderiales bacterium]
MTWPNEISGASVQRAVDAQAFLSLEHSGHDAIQQWQTAQLTTLMQWLLNQVPWWRERLGARVDLNQWHTVAVLSRFELRKMLVLHGAAPVPRNTVQSPPGAYREHKSVQADIFCPSSPSA